MSALFLAAVRGTGRETGVAFSADGLLAVEGAGEGGEGGVVDSATEAKHQVEGRLFLDVVVRKGAAVLELLSGEDQSLLIGGDSLLVLNFLLDVVDGVRRL